MRSNRIVPVLGAIGIAATAVAAPPVFTGPLPYQSIADSPYFGDGQMCYALETFPDGVQSQPAFQFNSQTGAEIVPGIGVPPGGHVLQANPLGVIQLSFTTPVFEAGFVWTGGDSIGSTITLTVISGTEAISQQYANLPPNDPNNPADNRFFGVAWDVGIQQLRITFLPFAPSISNQVDDIQFNLAPQVVAIDPSSAAFDAAGGSGSFGVIMNGPACGWSASTGDQWITLTTASGTGDGSVQFTVAENLGADIRTGTIAVGSFSFTVNQSSASCAVTGIDPSETTVAAAGGSGSFAVTVTAPTCAWSATANDAWITLTTGSGTGDGTVQFSVAENTSADPRSGTIAVGGFVFAVNQEPAACAVTGISASEASLPAAGGSGSFGVTVNGSACAWSATASDAWITLNTASGTGDGSVQFTVAENMSAAPRAGTIDVDGFTFTVNQASPQSAVLVLPDTPYLGLPDSPFFGTGVSCFEVEFFPNGEQSVSGLNILAGTIASGSGVAPGGHVLQASEQGQMTLEIDAAAIPGGQPPTQFGMVWTGGGPGSATITVTDPNGAEFIDSIVLGANDPSNPSDNRFIGVEWVNGIRTVRLQFDPASTAFQFDQIQFELPAAECQTGQPDFNGDGWNDLVVQDPATGQVGVQALLDGQSAGLVSIPQPAGGVWKLAALGNFGTGVEGRDNIVWRNSSTGACVVWNMDGCLRTGGYTIQQPVSLNWRLVGTGDFNGDGVDDMVWQEVFQGTLVVWYMQNGQRSSGQLFQSQSTPSWEAIGVGDFNGDGTPDLVWRNVSTTALAVWFMGGPNGTTRLGGASINQPAGLAWSLVGVSDLDNDGDSDLIWQNVTTGSVVVWIMNGTTREAGYTLPLDVSPASAWRVQG